MHRVSTSSGLEEITRRDQKNKSKKIRAVTATSFFCFFFRHYAVSLMPLKNNSIINNEKKEKDKSR
jgi:hypothetical protein